MATQGSTADFGSGDEPWDDDVDLMDALKEQGMAAIQSQTPTPLALLGNHYDNMRFTVEFDTKTDTLQLGATICQENEIQCMQHQAGTRFRQQQSIFCPESSVVERAIVSLQDELREFFVMRIFDPKVAELSESFEEEGAWEKFYCLRQLAEAQRDRLLHALLSDLPDFRLDPQKTNTAEIAGVPFCPLEETYRAAVEYLTMTLLLRLFAQSKEAEAMLNQFPTDQMTLIPHYHGNGSFTLTLQAMHKGGQVFDTLLLVSTDMLYRVHPSLVASTLNSMTNKEEQAWRRTIADKMFHLLLDLKTEGSTDIDLPMITAFYKKMIKGKLPVILDAQFGDIEFA